MRIFGGFILVFFITLFTGCVGDVEIVVNSIPSNTPNEPIYISGNFNYWDPADPRFILKLKPDSTGYFVKIPRGFGSLEYKFTRGDWKSVETNRCGEDIDNRKVMVFDDQNMVDSIESWMDVNHINCEYITIVLEDLPVNTPKQDEITLLADFNQWGESDQLPVFETDDRGRKILKLLKPINAQEIEFKISRGSLNRVECDVFGNDLPPRKIDLTKSDSIKLSIENWTDLANASDRYLYLIINKTPNSTATDEDLFLASDLNNWYPRDKNFKFEKLKNGKYILKLPNQPNYLEYKITRGSWNNVEVDIFGNAIENRRYQQHHEVDTVNITIAAWKDQNIFKPGEITFMVKAPKSTKNDDIYIAGNFNGWDEKDKDHRLTRVDEGIYSISLTKSFEPIHFKFTRGTWEKVETDKMGREIENRSFSYKGEDTINFVIESWRDVVLDESPNLIILLETPKNTPPRDDIYLASEFTGNWWGADDSDFRFTKQKEGKYYLIIPKKWNSMEYKITRGSWRKVEVDEKGEDIENRYYQFGKDDTLKLKVEQWKDLVN